MKKILIVGCGGIGKKHIDGFLRTGKFEIYACESDKEKLQQVKSMFPVKEIYENFLDVDLRNFDGAVIATPANFHIEMANRCIDYCIPFLLEKPLSVNLEGVDDLVEKVKKTKIPHGVGYTRRSVPSYKRLKELVDSNIIGEVKMANFYCGQDYRKIRPDYNKIYFAKKDMAGGVLRDFITHFVDLAQWMIGRPEKGYTITANLVFGDCIETDDSALLIGSFSKNLVCFYCNAFQKPNEFIIDLAGTKGNLKYVVVSRNLSKILFADDDSGNWKEIEKFENEPRDYYFYQAQHFLNLLEGKPHNFTTIEEAAENLKFILQAIKMSSMQDW